MNIERLLLIPPNMLKLGEKQRIFAWNQHHFIAWVYKAGYELTFGEAFRPAKQAALNAKAGVGIRNTLHGLRLAVDWNLFKDGVWLQDSEDHRQLGTFWKTLHPLNRWGGDFRDKDGKPKPDGNHYSMEHDGVK